MLNGKFMIIHLILGLVKSMLLYKLVYFPGPCTRSKNKTNGELDLSNYATKSDAIGVYRSNFAKKAVLAHLELDVNYLDTDKLKTVPEDLGR